MPIIQIRASTPHPISDIINSVRSTVSDVCLGIDDMNLLGNKALVVRTDITSEKIPALLQGLSLIDIGVSQNDLESYLQIEDNTEYMMTLQIVSYAEDTDGKQMIPEVPG